MTINRNDFSGDRSSKTLEIEDFAGDRLQVTHYTDSIASNGFNVDVAVNEGGDESTVSLTRDDARVLALVLADLLTTPDSPL